MEINKVEVLHEFHDHELLQLAELAYRNISFSPKERGDRIYKEYLGYCDRFKSIDVPIDKLRSLYVDWLHSHVRLASPLITGPARFPADRMEKYRKWEQAKCDKLFAYINEVLNPPVKADIIKNGDDDAVEKMEAKIIELEAEQARQKALKPHERLHSFSLTYATKAVKDAKERLVHIQLCKARPDSEATIGDIRVVQSFTDNRVRLFFEGKPEDSFRIKLKKNGFRWTPSLGCWQAYNNCTSLEFVSWLKSCIA